MSPTSIPVVDLAGGAAAEQIRAACRSIGFFYVANHGVAQGRVEAQLDWARRFFDLPQAEKMALDMRNSKTACGYEPLRAQTLDSGTPPDLKESFYCFRGRGHDQWPASLPGFREQMEAYLATLSALGDRVLEEIAESLGLARGHFAPFYAQPTTTLRLLRYPPHPAAADAGQLGAGAHTDWGGITLLAQDDLGGLQVRDLGGNWVDAAPLPGTFVVNLGDLMQRWTNDIYRSNAHRVKNNHAARNRHSVAFFYGPRDDALIECLPGCATASNPARHAPITAGNHTREKFRESYGYARA